MWYSMIERSSVLPRKSSVIFGNLRYSSEIFRRKMFENDCLAFGQLFENLQKSSENVRNLRKLNRQKVDVSMFTYVINRILHARLWI